MQSQLTIRNVRPTNTTLTTLFLTSLAIALALLPAKLSASERLYNGGLGLYVNSVARRILHADINNDGNMDIINHRATSFVQTLLGDGDGAFDYGPSINF